MMAEAASDFKTVIFFIEELKRTYALAVETPMAPHTACGVLGMIEPPSRYGYE